MTEPVNDFDFFCCMFCMNDGLISNRILQTLCFFVVILTLHRCILELAEAQRLNVNVRLCPHIHDADLYLGDLERDICIANIKKSVDSFNAFCSMDSDKENIHSAILSQSERGFEEINFSVERIRLDYLLDYPVHKIQNNCPDILYDSYYSKIMTSRYITVIVYSLIMGMIAHSFGFHLDVIVLPLVGLSFDLLVRLIGNKGLTSRWENYTEGRTIGRGIFHLIYFYMLWYPHKYLRNGEFIRKCRREGVEKLAPAIMLMVDRVYSLGADDDIPAFEDYCETWSRLYNWALLYVFYRWKKNVECLIKKRNTTIKDAGDTTIVENMTTNKSTPLVNKKMA